MSANGSRVEYAVEVALEIASTKVGSEEPLQ